MSSPASWTTDPAPGAAIHSMHPPATSVLHLIEPAIAGWSGLESLRIILDEQPGGFAHRALVIGGSADERLAHAHGVNTTDRILAPGGRMPPAVRALRRFLEARGEPGAIHAWSRATRRIAARAAPGRAIIESRLEDPARAAGRFAISVSSRGGERRADAPIPIDPARLDPSERARRREHWDVSPETIVIALVGDPAEEAWSFKLAFLIGLLAETGLDVVGVAHPRAWQMERGRRLIESLRGWWRLIGDDAPPWSILPAADLALWRPRRLADRQSPHRRRPHADAAAWALACGVPLLAERDERLMELHELAGGAMRFFEPGQSLSAARGALDLISERRDGGAGAARGALAGHAPARFLESISEVYERLDGVTDAAPVTARPRMAASDARS